MTEATGRVARQFGAQEFVQQALVVVRAMNGAVALGAAVFEANPIVLRPVQRGNAMALLAECGAGLVQEALIGAAVRAMAGNAAAVTLGAE